MIIFRMIYFCGYFDAPSTSKVFEGAGSKPYHYGSSNSADGVDRLGAVFTFNESHVTSRVGISWISSEKACQFVNDEIPANSQIQDLVSASKSVWNLEVLSRIRAPEVKPLSKHLTMTLLSNS